MNLRKIKIVKAADVVQQTAIRASVDTDIINANIILAQDSKLAYVIGFALMNKLKQVIEDPSKDKPDKRYQLFTEEYVVPYLCWATAHTLIPNIAFSLGMGGVNTQNSDQGTSVFESSMAVIKQNILNGSHIYKKLLLDHLCTHSSLYPEYHQINEGKQKATDGGKPFNGIQFY